MVAEITDLAELEWLGTAGQSAKRLRRTAAALVIGGKSAGDENARDEITRPLVPLARRAVRLQGRDCEAVWGELAFNDRTERFRYELGARRLTIGAGEGQRAVQLDDMGVESD